MGYGFAGHIGLAKEASWGSGQTATDFLEAYSENLTLALDRFEVKNIVGGRMYAADDMVGMNRVEGDIVFPAHPTPIGFFLRSVLGTMSKSIISTTNNLYQYDFTFATTDFSTDTPIPPYTFEIFRDVTSAFQYTGGVVSRLQLSVQPNQDVRATAHIFAKVPSVIAKSSPTFPTSPTFPFAFDTCSISIGGVANALLEAISLDFNTAVEGIPRLNASRYPAKMLRTAPQVLNLTGTIGFDNLTEYTNFINQTEQAFVLNFTRADSFSLKVDMPRVVYKTFPTGMPGRERLTVSFEAMARYHSGSGQAVKVTLTNCKSDY